MWFSLMTSLAKYSGASCAKGGMSSKSTVRVRRAAALTIVAACVWTSVTGCSGDQQNDEILSPQVVVSTAVEQTVLILVPPDTGALFKGIAILAEGGGLPYKLQIMEGNSAQAGVRAVLDGKVDLALVMQQPPISDTLVYHELFRTSVVIFVNSDPGIDELTREQAAAIFSGDITNWSQIGGPQIEITVFVQEHDDTTTIALQEYLLGSRPFGDSAQILFSDRDIITVVSGMPGSIGYSAGATKNLYDTLASDDLAVSARLNGEASNEPDYLLVASVGLAYLLERQAELEPVLDWAVNSLDSEMGWILLEQYHSNTMTPNHVATEGSGNAQEDWFLEHATQCEDPGRACYGDCSDDYCSRCRCLQRCDWPYTPSW
jgi:ABC-type phosphate transport system substrate-binding protein